MKIKKEQLTLLLLIILIAGIIGGGFYIKALCVQIETLKTQNKDMEERILDVRKRLQEQDMLHKTEIEFMKQELNSVSEKERMKIQLEFINNQYMSRTQLVNTIKVNDYGKK